MNKEEIMVMNKKLNNFEHDYIATKEENTNLKQALNEIRKYINEDNYKDETIWCGDLIPIKKIIDKVLGDEK